MTIKKIIYSVILVGTIVIAQDSLRTISINAVGDIMLGTNYPQNRLPASDGELLLKDVYDILSSADLTIGNYEGVLIDGGIPHKKCKDSTKCYLYRTPTVYVKNLKKAGFDFISVANNHANDFGSEGIKSSIKILQNAGIKISGPVSEIADTIINDKKICFIAFATSPGMYTILDIPAAAATVKKLKDEYDIVIVSFHGGAEGEIALHVNNQMENAYGERRGNVVLFAHSVIDAGADLVIGHGPHVPRAMELYNKRLIAYSMGNFCTYEGFSLQGSKGIAPILNVKINSHGEFVSGEIISTKQERPYGPLLDSTYTAFNLIKKLTQSDFPLTKLIFENNRMITPAK